MQRIDTRGVHRAVDVGGTGAFVHALMQADPDLRGAVLDTPDVAREAEQRAAALGLGDRFEAVPGDFLVSVPAGDLLLLEFVLHDDTPTPFASSHDLGMLTVLGGRERTSAEHRALLAEAGFRVVRATATTPTPHSVLEAEVGPTTQPPAASSAASSWPALGRDSSGTDS